MRIIVLGPQRSPTVDSVVRSLRLDGPIATITAGWQEREPDDEELDELLDSRSVNLSLYARWLDVQERDPDFAAADRRLREVLGELQDIYLMRLDHALRAVYDVQRRVGDQQLRADVATEAVGAVRELDARHLDRISDLEGEFYADWPPHERPVIAEHRTAVEQALSDAAALVVTGGHVGVLLGAMHLFNVAASLRAPVIAWSAGAMALTDRIVLFHDRCVQGPGNAELFGRGLSLLRDVVPLPHAGGRLLLDDADRMSVFARRFAPARCVLLEPGSRVDIEGERIQAGGARILADDGTVTALAAA